MGGLATSDCEPRVAQGSRLEAARVPRPAAGRHLAADGVRRTLIISHEHTRCSLAGEQYETILAQEQGANMRSSGASKELEAEFGVGVREGTLVLTNKRLIFVCTNESGEDLPIGYSGEHTLLYSEVEDLQKIPDRLPNIFIPLEAATAQGRKEGMGRPSLRVAWKDEGGNHDLTFTETLTGRRKRNLNDWAPVMEKLKNGTQKLNELPKPPSIETLEGKVMHVLADMQEKGLMQIEETVEGEYGVDLDPDQVQTACDALASQHIVVRFQDQGGESYYRRISPLGEDGLSS